MSAAIVTDGGNFIGLGEGGAMLISNPSISYMVRSAMNVCQSITSVTNNVNLNYINYSVIFECQLSCNVEMPSLH